MKKFATGKKAFGFCDICGFRTKLRDMKEVIVKRQGTSLLACNSCWDPDHPQNMQGEYPVNDPQALRNPRPDQSLSADSSDTSGRAVDWGWSPVGSGPNMAMEVKIGTVTVTVE